MFILDIAQQRLIYSLKSPKSLLLTIVSQMFKRHNNTQINKRLDLAHYFNNPVTQRQKQYEVVRALVLEKQSVEVVAKRFGYKISTIYSLIRDAKAGKVELFPVVHKGPQRKQTPSDIQDQTSYTLGVITIPIHKPFADLCRDKSVLFC